MKLKKKNSINLVTEYEQTRLDKGKLKSKEEIEKINELENDQNELFKYHQMDKLNSLINNVNESYGNNEKIDENSLTDILIIYFNDFFYELNKTPSIK